MEQNAVLFKELAQNLRSFSIEFNDDNKEFERILARNVMQYIGQKYQNVSKLCILMGGKDTEEGYLFPECVPNNISNMKNLTSCAIYLVEEQFNYEILQIIERNGVQLQYVKLFLESMYQEEGHFHILQRDSTVTKSLEYLNTGVY